MLFLGNASLEPLEEFAAKTSKAGVKVSKARDTINPAFIIHFLMTLIEVNGSRVYPPLLRKRIKDDVTWDDSGLPWRRIPFWLMLRVSVQRLLCLAMNEENGQAHYKFLMCGVLAQLLTDSISNLSVELCSVLRAKLCRLLAKLENEKAAASASVALICNNLSEDVGSLCRSAIEASTSAIEAQWNAFKVDCRRKVPSLPLCAQDSELQLTLPNSGSYLQEDFSHRHQRSKLLDVDPVTLGLNSNKTTTKFFGSLTSCYFALEASEMSIESAAHDVPGFRSTVLNVARRFLPRSVVIWRPWETPMK